MKRRPLPVAAALAATAALLLTACGSGGDTSVDNDKIVGAGTGSETSAPSSSSTETAVERPKIELPSDLTYSFDWPKAGDADKDAVLNDAQQFIKAVDMAIAKQDPLNRAYRFYSEGTAAAGSQQFIQEFVDYGDRITGVKRFYNANVKISNDGTAGLVYCEDQNKAYNKSLKTGKTQVTPESNDNYVVYNSRLRVNERGIWITEELTSQRGSAVCRP